MARLDTLDSNLLHFDLLVTGNTLCYVPDHLLGPLHQISVADFGTPSIRLYQILISGELLEIAKGFKEAKPNY